MDGVLLERNHGMVNYSSISYGRVLFRSPNSPPPSPSRFPHPSVASLSHLFVAAKAGVFTSRPQPSSSLLPLPTQQPPLLSLPRRRSLLEKTPHSTAGKPRSQKAKRKGKKVAPEKGEGEWSLPAVETVYSMAPPPSSLPLPRFLTRPRASLGSFAQLKEKSPLK
ncbi:hypothetical protein HPP92_021852 [Vanilla planifolia]|uniref:Uncharacterized protein n=1 Tax=Vanilla planifolia TaxID=51239 RepID=A0A835UDC2_VANPL|nr:hypothetical protein HPP92_022172 [Vanilla planifolia]KAG0458724.1 hypothetical protein HPP92_021852 [Vanilla planifolia]